MSGYPSRLQTLWIVTLALTWTGFCSPWAFGVNILLAACVAVVAIVALVRLTYRVRERRRTTAHALAAVDGALRGLPTGLKRHTPLVIVAGDPHAMAGAWGSDTYRITDDAIWVRCNAPAELMHLSDALKRWRNGQGPDAIALLMAADQGHAEKQMTVWKPWRSALSGAGRAVGYALPLCMALYVEAPAQGKEACPWFGVTGSQLTNAARIPAMLMPRLQQYALTAHASGMPAPRAALLDALVRWASTAWLPMWMDRHSPVRVAAFGVTVVPGTPSPYAPFPQFVTRMTGLAAALPSRCIPSRYPLPHALLAGLSRQPVQRASPRALAHALMALVAFFTIGAAASAWQNRLLAQRVTGDVTRYRALPPGPDAARLDALNIVRRDRDELERYASTGVPMRLGFGLYRGAPWLPMINTLIASYRPPLPPPSMIELDSMSLFQSGSSALSPGSNRVLVHALELIRSHPDKRVLIAGHTDATGTQASNLALSQSRAAAVRDWLVDASGWSPTRFAIQGYGDTRPRASNDTDAGRAANRRVEITLIPDCRADDGSRSTEGPPAC